MSELVRFTTDDAAAPLIVEVSENEYGVRRVSRGADGIVEASQSLSQALGAATPTIRAIVSTIKQMAPDEHEIEFGIKLNAEAGVIVAKTALEGHFTVKLAWRRPDPDPRG